MSRSGYTREFKQAAVNLVYEQGYSPAEAAKSLGIHATTLRYWLKVFPAAAGNTLIAPDGAVPEGAAALKAELQRLREENRRLQMERDILKKAAVFFAKEQP